MKNVFKLHVLSDKELQFMVIYQREREIIIFGTRFGILLDNELKR